MPAAPRRLEGRTASAAGGDTGPSQRGSGAAAAAAVRRGRSTIPRPPQPLSSAASPRARARSGARARSRAAAAARARAHLQPRRRLALRPHPIGSAHLRLRRQPIGTQPAGLARPVGGPRVWEAPPTDSRLVLRCEGGAGSPEALGPFWIELVVQQDACAGCRVSAPRRRRGRPAGSASAPGLQFRRRWFFCACARAFSPAG